MFAEGLLENEDSSVKVSCKNGGEVAVGGDGHLSFVGGMSSACKEEKIFLVLDDLF